LPDLGTIVFSVGTTLALQAAYFVVLRYPDSFCEKVASMSIFHENHVADLRESNHILTATLGSTKVISQAYESFSDRSGNERQTRSQIIDDLQVMLAKLSGY